MDNKKIPTRLGAVILVVIAITVGGFVWVYEKNQGSIATDIPTQAIQKKAQTAEKVHPGKTDEKVAIAEPVEQWKTCRNEKAGYEVKYPSAWVLGLRGPYGFEELKDCTSTWMFFTNKFTVSTAGDISVSIDAIDMNQKGGANFKKSNSLEEYLQQNKNLPPIEKESALFGEKIVWLKDNIVIFYHNNTIFNINFSGLDEKFTNDFLSTFKFLN